MAVWQHGNAPRACGVQARLAVLSPVQACSLSVMNSMKKLMSIVVCLAFGTAGAGGGRSFLHRLLAARQSRVCRHGVCHEGCNPRLPDGSEYHTFLIDAEGNVLFVGNPLGGDELEKLYNKTVRSYI